MAETLARLLHEQGHGVHHWFRYGQHRHPWTKPLIPPVASFPVRVLSRATRFLGWPDLLPLEYLSLIGNPAFRECDLVHFHDLSSAISPITLKLVAREKPVVWTFHDTSPFTGGCLYPLDCERYKTRCGDCPQLGRWPLTTDIDRTGAMQDMKRRVLSHPNIHAAAPSEWMQARAMDSGLCQVPPALLPNGIDAECFQLRDKSELKRKLGLPSDLPIVLMTAADLTIPYKGVQDSLEVLHRLKEKRMFVLTVGRTESLPENALDGIPHHHAGLIKSPEQLAEWFCCADVLLNTPLAETFSLITAEAMACGVPIVGYATGGVPEILGEAEAGKLVPTGDRSVLAEALCDALENEELRIQWRTNARKRIEERFTLPHFLAHHLELYEKILSETNTL